MGLPPGAGFKKGQSGNPSGRPALPPHLAKIRKFSRDEINALFSKYLRMTREELRVASEDEKTPAIELWLISISWVSHQKHERWQQFIGKKAEHLKLK